jgi:hypothetical protein
MPGCGPHSRDHTWVKSAYRILIPGTSGDRKSPTRRVCSKCGRREHKVVRTLPNGKRQGLWYLTTRDHASAQNANEHPRIQEQASLFKRTLSVAQLAYLAGLVDGDGSIMVRRRVRSRGSHARRRGSPDRRRTGFTTILSVGGETVHLTNLRSEFGNIGTLYVRKRKGQRHLAEWRNADSKATSLIVVIVPYLRLKRQQAELVISMPRARSRWAATPEIRKRQEWIRSEIQRLNRRGRGKKRQRRGS